MPPVVGMTQNSAMNYFQIVREAISAAIADLASRTGRDPAALYQEVVTHLANNSAQWRSNKMPLIPYDSPLCRIAYLYGVVPANADLVERVFNEEENIQQYMDSKQEMNGEVLLCAIGGGPGTELLGVAKHIERRKLKRQFNLDFLVADKVNEWMDGQLASLEERY